MGNPILNHIEPCRPQSVGCIRTTRRRIYIVLHQKGPTMCIGKARLSNTNVQNGYLPTYLSAYKPTYRFIVNLSVIYKYRQLHQMSNKMAHLHVSIVVRVCHFFCLFCFPHLTFQLVFLFTYFSARCKILYRVDIRKVYTPI